MEMWTYQPLPLPVDIDIINLRVQARVDVVSLVLREDDVSSVAALVEGFEDCWDVVGGVVPAREDGAGGAPIVISERCMLCYCLRYDGTGQQSYDRVRCHLGMR